MQVAPALSVLPVQVPDLPNFTGAAGYAMSVAAAVPVFDMTTVCATLVWPIVTFPKVTAKGVAVTLGIGGGGGGGAATPVPLIATCAGEPPV